MCRPSSVSSRMMSARGMGISSVWCSLANICSTVMGVGGWGQGGSGGEGGSCGSRKVHSTVPSSLSDSDQQDEDHDNPNYILAEPKVGTGWQKRREGLSTILLVTRLAAAQANLPPLGPVPGFDSRNATVVPRKARFEVRIPIDEAANSD